MHPNYKKISVSLPIDPPQTKLYVIENFATNKQIAKKSITKQFSSGRLHIENWVEMYPFSDHVSSEKKIHLLSLLYYTAGVVAKVK